MKQIEQNKTAHELLAEKEQELSDCLKNINHGFDKSYVKKIKKTANELYRIMSFIEFAYPKNFRD